MRQTSNIRRIVAFYVFNAARPRSGQGTRGAAIKVSRSRQRRRPAANVRGCSAYADALTGAAGKLLSARAVVYLGADRGALPVVEALPGLLGLLASWWPMAQPAAAPRAP
jgi:hypothetical protein